MKHDWNHDCDNEPHLCVHTMDGNVHVIPEIVFTKIITGEMKITDMDDWEIIIRAVLSEWLKDILYRYQTGKPFDYRSQRVFPSNLKQDTN